MTMKCSAEVNNAEPGLSAKLTAGSAKLHCVPCRSFVDKSARKWTVQTKALVMEKLPAVTRTSTGMGRLVKKRDPGVFGAVTRSLDFDGKL
jgi:hypothetical protein